MKTKHYILGAATGLVLENWLANILGQVINPLLDFGWHPDWYC